MSDLPTQEQPVRVVVVGQEDLAAQSTREFNRAIRQAAGRPDNPPQTGGQQVDPQPAFETAAEHAARLLRRVMKGTQK